MTRQRGTALLAALVVTAVAAGVSAALAVVARTAIILGRNRDVAAQAQAAADGCLAAIVAALPAGWEFDTTLAGTDGIPGTADDGVLAAPPGCTASARTAPGAAAPPRVLLEVEAVAGTGRRVVQGVAARTTAPGVGGLVWVADPADLRPVGGTLRFDGTDPARPAAPPLAPVATPGDPSGVDAWLVAQGARVVVVAGAAASSAPPPPVTLLADRLRTAGAATAGTLVATGTPPLALTLTAGDLTVGGAAAGRGLLLVDGLLDIAGAFEFNGVVVAAGGIRVASGARFDVRGAVWLATGARLLVDGEASVSASADALDAADGLLPLPRRAFLAGLRDPP